MFCVSYPLIDITEKRKKCRLSIVIGLLLFQDNRCINRITVAPLILALRRWSQVQPQENFLHDDEEEAYACSPTACLLRQADLSPESEDGDKDVDVDL